VIVVVIVVVAPLLVVVVVAAKIVVVATRENTLESLRTAARPVRRVPRVRSRTRVGNNRRARTKSIR